MGYRCPLRLAFCGGLMSNSYEVTWKRENLRLPDPANARSMLSLDRAIRSLLTSPYHCSRNAVTHQCNRPSSIVACEDATERF